MTRLEGNDLLMFAYIGALKRTYPEAADKVKKIYEQQRAVIEAEEIANDHS